MSTVREQREQLRQAARGAVRAAGLCEWFAMCTNPATVHVPHPILGEVPACQRCANRARS